MQNGNGKRAARALDVRWLVFAVVATVAVFSFVVSYSHIYDLGRVHRQAGTAARLLPLSVDLLIVAASLVLFTLERPKLKRSTAFWMPRLVLYAAIGATVAANVAYGLPGGWLSAVISGWPGAAFVAAVEVGILVADPVRRGQGGVSPDSTAAALATLPACPHEVGDPADAIRVAVEHARECLDEKVTIRGLSRQTGIDHRKLSVLARPAPQERTRGGGVVRHPAAPGAQDRSRGAQSAPPLPPAAAPAAVLPPTAAGALSPNGQAHG